MIWIKNNLWLFVTVTVAGILLVTGNFILAVIALILSTLLWFTIGIHHA